MHFSKVAAVVLSMGSAALAANWNFNNWCGIDIYIVQSHNGGCDAAPDGTCISNGGQPLHIPASNGSPVSVQLASIADGAGTSVKIAKDPSMDMTLQYEYTIANGDAPGIYYDLSNLDGAGHGLVGTPFEHDNIKLSPTGSAVNTGACVPIRCQADQVCVESYQHPDDSNTKTCPLDIGDFNIDLCPPNTQFWQKRAVKFIA